jgi:thiamine kinase-like enzyme
MKPSQGNAPVDPMLDPVIERMPAWSARSIRISALSGGITNRNFRVDVDDESYVVRIYGRQTELLGVNRSHEYECNVSAAATGVAPQVVAYFPELASIVTRFVSGKAIPPDEIGSNENIRRVAQAIRRLHSSRPYPGTFSPFRTIEEYRRTSAQLGSPMPDNVDELFHGATLIEEALYRRGPQPLAPCHNDLLNENLIDDGSIRIIDYEYAAMGDRLFDLGNFAVHHRFGDEQDALLLRAYFGDSSETASEAASDAPADSLVRLKFMKMASDLREAMWGVVQIRLSRLDFDYGAYADRHFARFRSAWNDPRVPSWLDAL